MQRFLAVVLVAIAAPIAVFFAVAGWGIVRSVNAPDAEAAALSVTIQALGCGGLTLILAIAAVLVYGVVRLVKYAWRDQ